ncbi:MAG TPA: tryptophanase [Thermoanaerobaculaceae bacterium]|nr:MAG: tyrosine phenol-lyase [Acidobacteria bacterium 37-71-11]HQT93159.1 tryptophanase [Thermoanaerobaculaceae bacterium]HQU33557.1 tryptophanase [Thermoanaerobaculaceae bacterium]
MKTVIEPYRSRVVESMRMTTREERERFIREAGYNPFLLRAEQVLIDLVTDSGTSALSTRQWSAMHGSDESFTGSRSFYRFQEAVQRLFGHAFVIPCHQGRAAEHLLARAVVRPGNVIFANTHFATTRENFEEAGADVRDLPIREALDRTSPHAFKGNIDLDRLEAGLAEVGARARMVILTVTDNSRGGQPVSMANVRAAHDICRQHGVPLWLDAARFAENCFLVKLREEGYAERSPREIARELFRLTDGVFMSLKKDALGNTGGLITVEDEAWAEAIRVRLLASEGIPTAGGLAGRDLEALAVAFDEMLEEDYLAYRIASTRRLGGQLQAAGVPLVTPFGAHAVYVDGRAFCPHLTNEQLPAWSLSVALYLHSGVRAWETGNVMQGRQDAASGAWRWPDLDLMRLAIPRRVYSQSHLDYAAEAVVELYEQRASIRGLRFVYRPQSLAQFVATFEPV